MREMVHREGGLEAILRALVDIAELAGGVEYQSIDGAVTQPRLRLLHKGPHALQVRQIEWQHLPSVRWRDPRADYQLHPRRFPNLFGGNLADPRCGARHNNRVHANPSASEAATCVNRVRFFPSVQ